MKIKLLACLLVLLLTLPAVAAPPKGWYGSESRAAQVDNDTWIDANKILMFVTNHGNFGRDLSDYFGYDYGTWYPYAGDPDAILFDEGGAGNLTPLYASGLWIGAKDSVTDSILIAISEYDSEYVPGPMAGGTFQTDVPEFRVYKLYSDSLKDNPNQDYLDYMADAVGQGAPTITDGEGDLVPDMIGDQMLWSVYNDANPDQHTNNAASTSPLGIEIEQTTFAFDREDQLGNMVFIRYQIYNRGTRTLDSCFFSLWADPDLGLAGDDLVGCDTNLSVGYIYNSTASDNQYSPQAPPCMGYDFFQGPLEFTGNAADTALMWGDTFPQYINLPMSSFNKYINGTDPDSPDEIFTLMKGNLKDGSPYTFDGQTLTFVHTGNPSTGQGDLDIAPADRRFMMTTGPVTFRPGDSTEIYAAIMCAQAVDHVTSIDLMKFNDKFAQDAYTNAFVLPDPPASPNVSIGVDGATVSLYWDNAAELAPGDYPFEGYSVWQGETPNGPWTRIDNHDVANGINDIYDIVFNATNGALENVLVRNGNDLGLRRYQIVDRDYINGGPLRDLTTYYYRVDAYTYDPTASEGARVLFSTDVVSATPQQPVADVSFPTAATNTLEIFHPAGASGAEVVAEVIDPSVLTGDVYRVTFADTPGIIIDTILPDPTTGETDSTFDSTNIAWFLINTNGNDTLLAWQTDFSGSTNVLVTEGFRVGVSNPAAGFGAFEVVANGTGALATPVPGAFAFAGFPTDADHNNPGASQQAGNGLWGIHTADNGGTCGGGAWGSFAAFLSRATRDGGNNSHISNYDFEMRFTGDTTTPGTNGSYAIEWFLDDNVFWVPFELWRIGIGTPNNTADDIRLIPYIIDDGDDDKYNLESWGCVNDATFGGDGEHSASSLDNDPYTDWVYWIMPTDSTPGEAGYNAAEAALLAGTYGANVATLAAYEILARVVLMNWNGGAAPPFTQGLPETGTIFRMTTLKPATPADIYSFTAPAPRSLAKNEKLLDKIRAVPNPFYLFSSYDPNPGSYNLKWHHLPATCTIRVYNLAGELVRTIDKNDPSTAIASWDLLTENGLPVASGIYIYVVDAPGFGTKVGKMAIFVQSEVLDLY